MAFIPAANTAEITLNFAQADGSFAQNTFFVEAASAWDETSLTSVAFLFITWWENGDGSGNSYKDCQSHVGQLISVMARDLTVQDGPVVINTESLPQAGGSTNGSIELGTTWAVTARSGLAGRAHRGRSFLVNLETGFNSATIINGIDATHAAKAVAAFNNLITQVSGLTPGNEPLNLVVCSRYHGTDSGGKPIPRSAAVLTPVTSYGYHDLILDFQRRRAPAHNRHH